MYLLLAVVLSFCALRAADTTARPEDIIAYLNETIVWHRQLTGQQQLVNEPSDAIFLHDSQELSDQVVRLSFEFARAEARLIAAAGKLPANSAGGASQPTPQSSQYQILVDLTAKAEQQVKGLEKELEGMQKQLATATGRKRSLIEETIAETQSELDLMKVRRDLVQSMLEFATSTAARASGAGGLMQEIEEMARTSNTPGATAAEESKSTVSSPSSSSSSPASKPAAAAPGSTPVSLATAGDRKAEPEGILALGADLFDLRRKLHLIDGSLAMTAELVAKSRTLRTPLFASVQELARRGDELADQADTADAAALAQERKELEDLTTQFKQLSTVTLPLGKQNILLDQYKRNLTNWRNVVEGQYSVRIHSLLLRLALVVVALGVLFATAELWRRATFRYVKDMRRRQQFLIVRRIIVWPLAIIIVLLALANGLGSVTTFAGLLTAGIAVSLQNVILSVVGYFFLIGKYGVRVGDRIQVSGVTGDVIEVGLVRLHLMEVSGGIAGSPTGRVVAFSNSVVFQPDAALFKQIPGTSFVWHEVSLTVSADSDYHGIEKKMLDAVNKIFAEYHDKMKVQHSTMERSISTLTVGPLDTESRIRLVPGGIQVVVRYPAELEHAAEVDDKVTRAVVSATGHQPQVEVQAGATPAVKPAPK